MKKTEKAAKTSAAKKQPAAKKATVVQTGAAAKATGKKVSVSAKSNVNPELTDAFIQEVSDDVKNDTFKALWNRYGLFVIIFVALAVIAAVSFEKIRGWKLEQDQLKTENYMSAAQLHEDPENTIAALQKINEADHGIFGDFARLQIANVQLQENNNDEALATLEALIADKQANSEVKQIALIKLATYKVDTLSKTEMEKLLQPILEAQNSWTPIANDLLAMTAIREGNIETAKEIYTSILKVKDLPENFKAKIQDMLSSISNM